jgi:excisionase family DNA binding protein
MQTEVMTVHELCDYLQVSRGTIYRLLRTDGIPAFRVGSDWRFTRSRIEEWCIGRQQKQSISSIIYPVNERGRTG